MVHLLKVNLCAAAIIYSFSLIGGAQAADTKISAGNLYNTCKEGDNASREAEMAAQHDCDRYLAGFKDGAMMANAKDLCFPKESHGVSEMRRAFIKFMTFNTDMLEKAAAEGVKATFTCK